MKILSALIGAALALSTGGAVAAEDTIKIGVISSRSGPFALNGTFGEKGDVLAVEELNAKGGILGRKIELITTDDKSRAEDASRLFRELVASGAAVIVGNIPTGEGQAASALAKELKVPFFTVGGYARELTEEAGHRYFFRLIVNARGYYGPMAERLAGEPYRKWCTISLDFAYGRDMTKNVIAYLKAKKPDVQVIDGCEFWVPIGTTDFSTYITAILAHRPDALLFGGLVANSGLAFVTQANSFGLFKLIPSAHPALGWPSNNEGLRKEDIPANIITAGDYLYPPVDRPQNLAFLESYKARFHELPLSESPNSYTTIKFIAAAFEKAGKLDREAFIDAAEGLSIDHPAQGPITVRAFDHQATNKVWVGELAWDDKDGRPGLANAKEVSSEPYLPSAEEIARLRGGAASQ